MEPGAHLDLGWGRAIVGPPLGSGGMGTVFRGWLYFDPRGPYGTLAPTEAAIKVLSPELGENERARKLFLGEAEALRVLSHPNIVRFYGLWDRGRIQIALVLELVDGEPLSGVVERHARRARPGGLPCMPFARAWHYFQQLLGSLAATHELGIVHRDIKPSNVLIRRDGFVKLTDFGIARLPADAARITNSFQPGTGAYMSPEQVLGQPVDGRSDLYSAAIMLYEMIGGRTPFEGEGRNEIMVRAAQVEEAPMPLTRLVPQAPAVIDRLFDRALAKDPHARFPNAIAFGDAFRRALGLPDSTGWQAQQRFARHASAIVTGAGVAPIHPGTVAIAGQQAEEMRAAVDGAYRA